MRTHSSGEKLPRPGLSEPAGPKLHEEPPKPASQDVHGHRRHPGLERADVLASPARGPRPGQGLLHRLLRQGGVPGNDTEASHEAPIVLRKERTDLFVVQAALRVRVGTSKTLWGHGLLWRGLRKSPPVPPCLALRARDRLLREGLHGLFERRPSADARDRGRPSGPAPPGTAGHRPARATRARGKAAAAP